MKYIPFKTYGNWQTEAVLKLVMNQNPRGMLLDEMRKRIAIMDKLDEGKMHGVLKDEEFVLLTDAIKSFPFGVAHKDLLALIDNVLAADEPPAPMLETKPNANGATAEAGAS